jgi:hypothetical protein
MCLVLVILFLLCTLSGPSSAQDEGNYMGEYCFDMVNSQTLIYDGLIKLSGLLRLSVFSSPSGIYTIHGGLSVNQGTITTIPLVGTGVNTDFGLSVSLTGSTGFGTVPSVDIHTSIMPGQGVPFGFLGLAHRYIAIPGLLLPPPHDLQEIGHQPIAGTLTPIACP